MAGENSTTVDGERVLVCLSCGETYHGRWPHWRWTRRGEAWFHVCEPMKPVAHPAAWRELQ